MNLLKRLFGCSPAPQVKTSVWQVGNRTIECVVDPTTDAVTIFSEGEILWSWALRDVPSQPKFKEMLKDRGFDVSKGFKLLSNAAPMEATYALAN